jgi:hypothetical protein
MASGPLATNAWDFNLMMINLLDMSGWDFNLI